jgi:aldose 1-epimerase
MEISRLPFGTARCGRQVELYGLVNSRGTSLKVLSLGGIIHSLEFADRRGRLANVSCNLETVEDYEARRPFFGSLVGRYGNRIAGGRFSIDGREYRLALNNPPEHPVCSLHGGVRGFDSVLWEVEPFQTPGSRGLILSYVSPDGEEGFPGELHTVVRYELNDQDELVIDYTATTDKKTHVNLTNHTHWNLGGAGSGTILGHELMLNARAFLPADASLIPTGEVASVEGGALDFSVLKKVGRDIALVREPQFNGGYDHCLILDQARAGELSLCARLRDPASGRSMEVWTTEPAVQLYSGNFLDGTMRAFGHAYGKHGALCLETQHYPDSPNRAGFPSTLLEPGQTYRHTTIHRFGLSDVGGER